MEQIIWKTSWFAIVSHALYVHRDVKMRKCSFCDWNIINCTQSIDVRTNSMDLFWNCGYCLELLFYYSCIKKQFAFYFTFFSFDFAKSIYGHSLLFVIWVLLCGGCRTFVMPSGMCINPIHNKKGILHHSTNASSEELWVALLLSMRLLYFFIAMFCMFNWSCAFLF